MSLLNFFGEDVKLKMHKDKQKRVESYKQKLVEQGYDSINANALSEMEVLKPEVFDTGNIKHAVIRDYKEIKFFIGDKDFELLKSYIRIREYQGINIDSEFITSIIELLEKGFLKVINKKEVVINE